MIVCSFLTEDQITDIFSKYLQSSDWAIQSRATGKMKGADIVAQKNGKTICIEAKGGGSQTLGSKRYGQPFTRLQCQHHTDIAFAALPRMMARYSPEFVGIVLPNNKDHKESVHEILPAIRKLNAGVWLVGTDGVEVLNTPLGF